MVNNEAGKGDTYRQVDLKKYDTNYEAIFNSPCCEACGEHLAQLQLGTATFFCGNPKCVFYKMNIDYSNR